MAECKLVNVYTDFNEVKWNEIPVGDRKVNVGENPYVAATVKAYLDQGWKIEGSKVDGVNVTLLLTR